MLVLTRKSGQTIIISDQIRVSVVSVGRGRVQLGIEAPDSVPVRRIENSVGKRPSNPDYQSTDPSGLD
jgi:carbon storage regulator